MTQNFHQKHQEQQNSCSSGKDQEHRGTARGLHTSEILTELVYIQCQSVFYKKNTWISYIYKHFCSERTPTEWSLSACRQEYRMTKSVWFLQESLGQHKLALAAPKVTDRHFPVSAHLWNSPKVCFSEEVAKSLMNTPSFQRSRGSWRWLDEARLDVHAHCWNWLFQKWTISV